MTVTPIPLDDLVPDPTQPRAAMTPADLDALAGSIRDRGLLLPLRVKPAGPDRKHLIVSGHRRHAALVRLGRTHAACVVADAPLDEAAVLAEQLTENLLREDLDPLAEAEGYRRYIALRGITAALAAGELHVPPARISRALPLLTLPEEYRAAIRAGRTAKETAYHLSRLPAGEERTRLIERAVAGSLTRDEAARAARSSRTHPVETEPAGVARVTCKLTGGRAVTVSAPAIRVDTVIETLEELLIEARKARRQGWDASTLARACRDRAAGGVA